MTESVERERSLAGARWFFAADLDRARRVRASHLPSHSGLCWGCGIQAAVTWPCVVLTLAEEALRRQFPLLVPTPRSERFP